MKNTLLLQAGGLAGLLLGAPLAWAGKQYNALDDAAVAQAQEWQAGRKAKPILSSDGMVRFPFGESMPKLTCSPTRACDVEMQPGERPKKVILGDKANWIWDGAESIENGKPVQHVIFQPRDNDLESNAIITTDRRTYHIKLYAPKEEGVYLNRVGFYYPQELVASWDEKMGAEAKALAKDEGMNVLAAPVSPDQLDYGYRIDGEASFKPVRVVNDGERVYIQFPESVRDGDNPSLQVLDENGSAMVVNYRRKVDPATRNVHYEVDKLFAKAELIGDNAERVRITWKKREKGLFTGWFGAGN